jgi:hypothetical protein
VKRRLLIRLATLLAVAAIALWFGMCNSCKPRPPAAALLLVDFTPDAADVRAIVPADSPPPAGARPPRLASLRPGDPGEYVVVFHGRDGKPLAAHGLDGSATGFSERTDPRDRGRLRGGPADPPVDRRLLHFAIPNGAAAISFLRAEIVRPPAGEGWDVLLRSPGGGDEALGVRGLGGLGIPTLGGGPLDWPDDLTFPDPLGDEEIRDLIERIRRHRQAIEFSRFIEHIGRIPVPLSIHTCEAYRVKGDPEETFNVAILGDGFTADEAPAYKQWAKALADTLLAVEPFLSKSDRINIYIVTSKSQDSGISDCSDYAEAIQQGSAPPAPPTGDGAHARKTPFGVFGYASDPNSEQTWWGYFDVGNVPAVYAATGGVVDPEDVDLYVIIANCACGGGAARPDVRIAIVGLPDPSSTLPPKRELTHLALHEIGHAVAGLGEEYISCRFKSQYKAYPNVVREADAESAWWKRLADVEPDGTFATRYDCQEGCDSGDPGCPDAQNSGSISPAAFPKLGLYWGAQYIDADPDQFECLDANGYLTFSSLSDTLSRHYYRPASCCRMRGLDWPWCGACADTIASKIVDSSW